VANGAYGDCEEIAIGLAILGPGECAYSHPISKVNMRIHPEAEMIFGRHV
jgi:hypothetical protein